MLSMSGEDAAMVYSGQRRSLFLKRCWEDIDAVVFIYDRSASLVTGVFSGSTPVYDYPSALYRQFGEISAMTENELLNRFSCSGKIYSLICSRFFQFSKGISIDYFGLDVEPSYFTYLDDSTRTSGF